VRPGASRVTLSGPSAGLTPSEAKELLRAIGASIERSDPTAASSYLDGVLTVTSSDSGGKKMTTDYRVVPGTQIVLSSKGVSMPYTTKRGSSDALFVDLSASLVRVLEGTPNPVPPPGQVLNTPQGRSPKDTTVPIEPDKGKQTAVEPRAKTGIPAWVPGFSDPFDILKWIAIAALAGLSMYAVDWATKE
jgi:hypothetical protein